MKKEIKEYRNSLRLFLIFIGGVLLLNTIQIFAIFGGIGMVYSIMAFFINAEVPSKRFWEDSYFTRNKSEVTK